jgi:small subunit ribosomal protein S20
MAADLQWSFHMATHADAMKRTRQNEKRRARNRHYRTKLRNQTQRVHQAVLDGDSAAAQEQFRAAVSIIQRVAQRGVIHKNQAARRISRLSAAVKSIA